MTLFRILCFFILSVTVTGFSFSAIAQEAGQAYMAPDPSQPGALLPPEIDLPEPEQENIMDKISRLPPDIQDQLMAESHRAYRECKEDIRIERYHDCECYAMEYLKARYEQPGELTEIGFLRDVNYDACFSKPKIAGLFYERCMKLNSDSSTPDMTEDVCACVARLCAENYSKVRPMFLKEINYLYYQSQEACLDSYTVPR